MIRPLRIRHRRLTTALAVLAPLGLAAAISVRPPARPGPPSPVLNDALTEAERPVDQPLERVFVRDFGPFGGLPLTALLGRAADGRTLVEFRPTAPLLQADLLVYWRPAGAAPDQLSGDALLLGRLTESPRRFALPPAATRDGGELLLFDLARGQALATRTVPTLQD